MKSVDLVFLGDSITQAWETNGMNVWDTFYRPRNALNLGFNGDRTEHVLWRLEHGAVEGIRPKLLVLSIGTNNTGHRQDPAEETALGIQKIVDALQERLPNITILLLAIFPRSAKPTQRMRRLNNDINALIQSYADNTSVFYLDINPHFLTEDGRLTSDVMTDFLHPNKDQYLMIARLLEPHIKRLMLE
ncbi:GDSL-type esterase/lipase family protein [Marinomonas algicola]|uniref:GDSL-type esterase/lipase family protein n=1 Tax=Marinomonas algicola TaxID=2773454 RepID=UPI00174AFB1B|nr:GDSL-type esterase/lipase family protein [Marinomonas algicola]